MEKIGSIFVDAGIVMIGDPCYTLPDDASDRTETIKNWDLFCNKLDDGDVNFPFANKGTGIVVSSGYGDGEYPVYIERDGNGVIASLTVKFVEEDEE